MTPIIVLEYYSDLMVDVNSALLVGPVHAYSRVRQSGRARTDLATAAAVLGEAAWKSIRVEKGAQR